MALFIMKQSKGTCASVGSAASVIPYYPSRAVIYMKRYIEWLSLEIVARDAENDCENIMLTPSDDGVISSLNIQQSCFCNQDNGAMLRAVK